VGTGVVPRDEDRPAGVFIDQSLQQFGNFASPFALAKNHFCLPRVVIDRADAVVPGRLPWYWDHDLLSFRRPQRLQGGQPTDIELVGIIEHISRFSSSRIASTVFF